MHALACPCFTMRKRRLKTLNEITNPSALQKGLGELAARYWRRGEDGKKLQPWVHVLTHKPLGGEAISKPTPAGQCLIGFIKNSLRSGSFRFSVPSIIFKEKSLSHQKSRIERARGRSLLSQMDPSFLGQYRAIAIHNPKDLVVQRMLLDIIEGPIDRGFSRHSFAFRHQKKRHQQAAIDWFIKNSKTFPCVLSLDIKKFYYYVDHGVMRQLFKRAMLKKFTQAPSWALDLIDDFLSVSKRAYGFEDHRGLVQGSPLSPLFSNLYLDPLDKYLEKRHYKFVRYCDDIRILFKTKDRQKAIALKNDIKKFLDKKLKLELNDEKSCIVNMHEKTVNFLGFSFSPDRIEIRKSSIQRFIRKIQRVTNFEQKIKNGRRRPRLGHIVRQVNSLLGYGDKDGRSFFHGKGWPNYFLSLGRRRSKDILPQLRNLDGIVRRRMRGYSLRGQLSVNHSHRSPKTHGIIRQLNKDIRNKGLHLPSDVYLSRWTMARKKKTK